MEKPKKPALVFDIDGTLYEHGLHTISPAVLESLKSLKKQGYPIGIATSRSFYELGHLPKALFDPGFDFFVLEGGSLVLDKNFRVLQKEPLDPKVVQEIAEEFDKKGIVWRYSTREGNFFAKPPLRKHRDIMNYFYLQSPPYKPYEQEECYTILAWNEDPELPEKLAEKYPVHTVGYTGAVEITPNGVSKAKGLQFLKDQGMFDELVVFGDGDNDVEMFEMADESFAMANGAVAAREKADHVLPSIEEDGLGQYLLKLSKGENA